MVLKVSTLWAAWPESLVRHQRTEMSAGSQRRQQRSVSKQRPHQPADECGCFGGGTAECLRTPWESCDSAVVLTQNDIAPHLRANSQLSPHSDLKGKTTLIPLNLMAEAGGAGFGITEVSRQLIVENADRRTGDEMELWNQHIFSLGVSFLQ
jgi:hypothetical protein